MGAMCIKFSSLFPNGHFGGQKLKQMAAIAVLQPPDAIMNMMWGARHAHMHSRAKIPLATFPILMPRAKKMETNHILPAQKKLMARKQLSFSYRGNWFSLAYYYGLYARPHLQEGARIVA